MADTSYFVVMYTCYELGAAVRMDMPQNFISKRQSKVSKLQLACFDQYLLTETPLILSRCFSRTSEAHSGHN